MNPAAKILNAPSYARARLRLGLTGVGTFVVLSIVALALDLPAELFEGKGGTLFTNASLIAVWVASASALALPFEIFGGYLLPKRFGRTAPDGVGEWFLGWLRGVIIIVLIMSFSGALIVMVGRYGGTIGALATLGVLMVAMASLQTWLAQLVGGMRSVDPPMDEVENEMRTMGIVMPPIRVLKNSDQGFTGGISGPPTAETVVIPAQWFDRLAPESIAVLCARRAAIVDRWLRVFGLFVAMSWTGVAFAFASQMPRAGVYSAAEIVGTSLWFTVFSFIGLLVLPTPSRAATIAADAYTVETPGNTGPVLEHTLETLDRLQDDEPSRSPRNETFFHPIPSISRRKLALNAPETDLAPWHLARTAAFLSIAGMSPLSRLVHCNVGRPELWIFLPADG